VSDRIEDRDLAQLLPLFAVPSVVRLRVCRQFAIWLAWTLVTLAFAQSLSSEVRDLLFPNPGWHSPAGHKENGGSRSRLDVMDFDSVRHRDESVRERCRFGLLAERKWHCHGQPCGQCDDARYTNVPKCRNWSAPAERLRTNVNPFP
jgi:hypothetical protein